MLRHRLRTFTLWTGTLLSGLIVAAFVASAWWLIAIGAPTKGLPAMFLGGGSVTVLPDNVELETQVVCRNLDGLFAWNFWRADSGDFQVPLYAVFLAVAGPTLLVWRFWPKPPKPGHCRCGYDLTGNTSGVCPECGVEVQA